ncbi:MAG TPA: allantoinase AllB [Tepidisphaeraceae bacterium]|jgi:allantoinase|nr:allantoinase AllB [Tepidisphaeraceae bacterium]
MPFDLLIRGGQVVTPHGVQQADVAIENGQIVDISATITGPANEAIDATGLHVFPGVIDPHVHFNEPGRTDWEGVTTGSSALAAGGGTLYFDMPLNSSPPVLDGATFDAKVAASTGKAFTDFALWGGLTPNNIDKLDELADRGVVGFKAFMSNSGIAEFPAADDLTLYRGMQIAARRGLVVAVHAENDTITSGLAAEAIRRGNTGIADYLASRPVVAEVEAIRRACTLAGEAGCKLHIVHVSSSEGAWAAHANGGHDVTYETCPHYLLLTEDDLATLGAIAKCAPPLRRRKWDIEHLQLLLHTGEISFVASDHSPAPPSMKQGNDFFAIWGGIAGVQSTLPAMFSLDHQLPLNLVARYTATAAAERFGIAGKGVIALQCDADLTLVDLNETYELKREELLDRHKLSPYVGRTFRGRIRRTILRGQTVFLDGKIVGGPMGRLVRPIMT